MYTGLMKQGVTPNDSQCRESLPRMSSKPLSRCIGMQIVQTQDESLNIDTYWSPNVYHTGGLIILSLFRHLFAVIILFLLIYL